MAHMNPDQFGDQLPSLRCGGLLLRWLTADDVPDLRIIFGDADVVRFMAMAQLSSEATALEFLAEIHNGFRAGTLYQWGLEVDRAIVGTCTLANIDRRHRRTELGFALAKPFWGRGLMRSVLPVVIEFAFERLALHRIEADADPRNAASLRVLERLGFQREGLLRERYFQFGEPQDGVVFGLLRKEWHSRAADTVARGLMHSDPSRNLGAAAQ
jgi:RimJ/RimL family protein N-acetyltransferase